MIDYAIGHGLFGRKEIFLTRMYQVDRNVTYFISTPLNPNYLEQNVLVALICNAYTMYSPILRAIYCNRVYIDIWDNWYILPVTGIHNLQTVNPGLFSVTYKNNERAPNS